MARCLFISACVLFSPLSPVWASHTEQRHFSVLVDGKEAGHSLLTIVEQEDGSAYVTASAKVDVRHLVAGYTFTIEGQEWWKDGKLIGMKSLCNDNGKRCDLLVSQRGDQLLMRVNGMDRAIRPDVWTTSYWKLADARFHNKQVPLLEADTGKEFNCQLKFVGNEKIKVGAQLPD